MGLFFPLSAFFNLLFFFLQLELIKLLGWLIVSGLID